MSRYRLNCAASAVVAVLGVASVLTATVLADDPPISVEGPVTGATYVFDHSCLSSSFNDVARTDSRRFIETELDTFGPTGTFSGGSGGGFLSSTRDSPVFGSFSNGQSVGSWMFKERFEDEGEFVEVARGSWNCPTYDELATSVFVPISPTRVLDTRPAAAVNYSGPKPGATAQIEITPSMMPQLPDDVVAVSANVGLVASSAKGFVQLLPTGQAPGGSSTLNASGARENVLNQAVSATGTGGGVTVFTSDGGHLTLDINGYFVASNGPERAGRAVSIDADRVLDTRNASPANPGGARIRAETTISVDLSADSALPAGEASAAIVNIAATKTAGGRGFVQTAAAGSLTPGDAAILNTFGENDSVGALAIVPVLDGSIDLYTSVETHLVVDVLGWFTSDAAASSTSGRFTPLPPERLFDSRFTSPVNYTIALPPDAQTGVPVVGIDVSNGARLADVVTDIEMRGIDGSEINGGRPAASSIFANIALVNSTSRGFLQAAALDSLEPGSSSNVNAARAGQNVTNAAIVPFSETIFSESNHFDGMSIYTSGGGQIVVDVVGFFTI